MAKSLRKRPAKERKTEKVSVDFTTEKEVEKEPEVVEETQGTTVVENEIPAVETTEEVNVPQVEKTEEKSDSIKEWTEEELVILPREEFYKVLEDIKAGKAKCKQRKLHN